MEPAIRPAATDAEVRSAYDAAFAWAALAAGTLTLVACSLWFYWMAHTGSRLIGIRAFAGTGVAIVFLAGITGTLRRLRPAPPEVRSALWSAVLPPVAACLGASVLFFWNGAAYSMGVVWIVCYGLALLNVRPFLSPAIVRTGWLFLGTGIGLMSLVYIAFKNLSGYDRSDTQTLLVMALTFGGFHLLHALGHALRQRPR